MNILLNATHMKIRGFVIPALITVLTSVSSCYYDSEEYLYPQTSNQCDTTQVTYALSVVPIIQNNCLSCHSNSTAANYGSNIKLEDYPDIKVQADAGTLLGTISHENGFTPMPFNSSKLDDCKITTIRIWVNAGAPNN
jgi:hypothetical protein